MSEKVTIKVERKTLHLPTIALRGLVVFPNNLVHFEVGREKSIAAVEWAMANNSNVFWWRRSPWIPRTPLRPTCLPTAWWPR